MDKSLQENAFKVNALLANHAFHLDRETRNAPALTVHVKNSVTLYMFVQIQQISARATITVSQPNTNFAKCILCIKGGQYFKVLRFPL